jgi:hypothetical protein
VGNARAAWRMEAWRERAEELRIEDPDEYQRILGLATGEGQRLVEKDPAGLSPSSSPIPRALGRARTSMRDTCRVGVGGPGLAPGLESLAHPMADVLLSLVSNESPDPVCLRAAEIVSERWTQGRFGLPGQARCLDGALMEAAGQPLFEIEQRWQVACVLGGMMGVWSWNDEPGRTAAEVAQVLRQAARLTPPRRAQAEACWFIRATPEAA